VDFVLSTSDRCIALEVKSGRNRDSLPGIREFQKRFSPHRILLVGADGIPIEEFLRTPPARWLE